MKNAVLWGLVLLNALLLAAFVGRISGSDAAMAQSRRPNDYLLIPANIAEEGSSAVVYMLDSTNGILGGMVFDDSRRELNTMQPINIDRVFQGGESVTSGTGNAGSNPREQGNTRTNPRRVEGGRVEPRTTN